MTAPARRRSAAPDAGAVAELTSPRLTHAPDVDPVVAAAAPPRPRRKPAGDGAKEQLKLWVSAEDAARIRAAFLHTRTETGDRSLSDLVVKAAVKEARARERKYNAGQQWPAAHPGDLPVGRPIGS